MATTSHARRFMARGAISLAGSIALMAGAAGGASATHGGIHPTFRTENVWFHCGDARVGNLGTSAPWNTTPPSQSVEDGAGCGFLESPLIGEEPGTPYDASFTGTFTGNIRDLTVSVYDFLVAGATDQSRFFIGLYIDGDPVIAIDGADVTVNGESTNMDLTRLFKFSIVNLGYTRDVVDPTTGVVNNVHGGFATEDGDGTTQHTISLVLDTFFLVQAGFWVWDTTEVPSGIVFNPETPETAQIDAGLGEPVEE